MTETVSQDAPASARRAVRAGAGATVTTIVCVLPVFLVGGLAVQLGDELRFSPAGLGLAVSIYFGVSALASVPSGALVERYGPATVARAGILLSAASLLAVAGLARSYPMLVTLLALSAAANALGQLASNAALAEHVPAHRQGLSFGVKQAAVPVATLLAGVAVPTVALTAGWRWAFVVAAGAALAALPAVPRTGRDRHARAASGGRYGGTAPLVVIGLAATLAAAAANALGTFLVDSAATRGLSPGLAGLTLTLGSAVCVLARVGVGWLADRRADGHVGLIAGMLLTGSVGLILLAVAGSAPLVAGVVLGFGLGWAWPGLMNFAVVRLHPQAPAAATSITQTGVYAGGCLGPLGLGALAGAAGYPAMWLTAAAAMLVAAVLMLLGARLLRRAPALG
ncbi:MULTISPECIES: MFS transporter [Micromonospora]|uniref:MFS transporter n=1 Tax=Micromonospora TaxID=1873 RepID=UPI0003EEB63B|nr:MULTISPECIES: MFS transporter [Micromonospora]EWM66417.1 major facilitator superfamily transporter [Micromonospora sp. M42]MBQ1061417.1 MFS transporter [Micromonospora sp. C41]MCK1807663.1 MFS transporter [Micromonospora sp. R42106]MCK1830074.1 MFS transporter [Micromonospora sp. R42003]MCK1844180.1 MFS transporter [Micromonospora sp. R42004]